MKRHFEFSGHETCCWSCLWGWFRHLWIWMDLVGALRTCLSRSPRWERVASCLVILHAWRFFSRIFLTLFSLEISDGLMLIFVVCWWRLLSLWWQYYFVVLTLQSELHEILFHLLRCRYSDQYFRYGNRRSSTILGLGKRGWWPLARPADFARQAKLETGSRKRWSR